MEFFTIGVYGSTSQEFFGKLLANNIDTFCDIRQRRAVRGSKYVFVNSTRLQQKLDEIEIKYGHILGLAPTKEIRELQKQADQKNGERKNERLELSQVFVTCYSSQILKKFDFDTFIENLENIGAKRVALFCVELQAQACHRSIVADELWEKYQFKVTHI